MQKVSGPHKVETYHTFVQMVAFVVLTHTHLIYKFSEEQRSTQTELLHYAILVIFFH